MTKSIFFSSFYSLQKAKHIVGQLYQLSPKFIFCIKNIKNTMEIFIDSKKTKEVVNIFTKHYNLNLNLDCTASDYPSLVFRTHFVYRLRKNKTYCFRSEATTSFISTFFTIKFIGNDSSFFFSVTGAYNSMNWPERELKDLFGAFFIDHPDFRRLLTDYGFSAFPFKKDFPLSGFVEVRFNSVTQRVVLEEIEFSQEFRLFDFLNPWVLTA